MRKLFNTRPEPKYEDYSTSHLDRGPEYEREFLRPEPRSLMWEHEKAVLREYVDMIRPERVLDVACGTGRIGAFVAATCSHSQVLGIDISPSMLEVARSKTSRVEYRLCDVRDAAQTCPAGNFNLVLAFRFFANADPGLRVEAARGIASLVAPGGFLIVNNHRNFWSSPYVINRARIGTRRARGAVNGEIVGLLKASGFDVVDRRSLGIWPHTERHFLWRTAAIARHVEKLNAKRWARRHSLGSNIIWLFRKCDLE